VSLINRKGEYLCLNVTPISTSPYKTTLDNSDIPENHRRFFERQLLYYIDEDNNCFLHAGFDRRLSFSMQRPENFYWNRDLWEDALTFHTNLRRGNISESWHCIPEFHEIFIGHTPTTNWGTDKPMRALNILNVDTGAGHNGRLTIMDIQSKEYWQSDPIRDLYETNAREPYPYHL
jgi:serine/threonine protein phosphatase 1